MSKNAAHRLISSFKGTGDAEEFRRLALRYAEIGEKEGIRIIPFASPDMPLFSQAHPDDQRRATEFLRALLSIHEETIAAGERAIDTSRLVWRALSRLSLVPPPDTFDRFMPDDIIIIFAPNQSAQFWNLQFFKFSSITVEQLLFSAWHLLTRREPHIQDRLYESAMMARSGEYQGYFEPGVPAHICEEVGTLENIRTMMELPWCTTLTHNGSFGGFLAVQRMKVI